MGLGREEEETRKLQASEQYLRLGLEHEISALEVVITAIDKIKRNHVSVSDERITKVYCNPAK